MCVTVSVTRLVSRRQLQMIPEEAFHWHLITLVLTRDGAAAAHCSQAQRLPRGCISTLVGEAHSRGSANFREPSRPYIYGL